MIRIDGIKYNTQKEAKKLMQIKGSLNSYRKRGIFSSIKHDGRFVYNRDEIISYINRRKNQKTDKTKINNRLKKSGLNFMLTSEINSVADKGIFQCNKCSFKWEAAISNACRKNSKCPQCYMESRKLNKNQVIDRLRNRPIKLLSEYRGSIKKHLWKCTVCDKTWSATVNAVLYNQTGCPHCQRLNTQSINKKLDRKNIILYKEYTNDSKKIQVKCKICGHVWESNTYHCISKSRNTQCPKCVYEKIKKNAFQKLEKRQIILLDEYTSVTIKNSFVCKKCGHRWKTTINGLRGCPECNTFKNEKLTGKYLKDIFKKEPIHNKRYYYENTTNKSKKYFKIDFTLKINDTLYFIEYNGRQHYSAVRFKGMSKEKAEKRFKEQRKRDKKLKKYCLENNIILIEIDGRKYREEKIKKYLIAYFEDVLPSVVQL